MNCLPNITRHYNSVSSRARTEAYAGLLLLLLGVTVLAFTQCRNSDIPQPVRATYRPLRRGGGALPLSVGYGSAPVDGRLHNGWWVGHFMGKHSPQYSTSVETKWAVHKSRNVHDGFSINHVATSMAVLIYGRHRMEFQDSYVILENPGDYVLWGPGVMHSWTTLKDSAVLSLRWPSIPDDQITTGEWNFSKPVVRFMPSNSSGNATRNVMYSNVNMT